MNQSLSTLEKESNLSLNTVENKTKFLQDIQDGRWDIILKQVNQLSIPNEKLFDLYEQVKRRSLRDSDKGKGLTIKQTDYIGIDRKQRAKYSQNITEKIKCTSIDE